MKKIFVKILHLYTLIAGKATSLMIENYLKPFSTKHSIKEAVISVFLVNPIIKPERFQKLLAEGLNEHFQLFEPVSTVAIEIKADNNGLLEPKSQNLSNVGFKFIGFDQGKVSRVLQGVNEGNRTFISYHTFSYVRWEDYLNEYIKIIKILSTGQSEIFINAVSIHYVDQFRWIAQTPLNLSKIFNSETQYMSKAFLDSNGPTNLIFATQKDKGKFRHSDRLEIKVDNNNSKEISISHNITTRLDDLKNLESLMNSESYYFNDVLQELHSYNKILLEDILNSEVKSLIHLPINNS